MVTTPAMIRAALMHERNEQPRHDAVNVFCRAVFGHADGELLCGAVMLSVASSAAGLQWLMLQPAIAFWLLQGWSDGIAALHGQELLERAVSG